MTEATQHKSTRRRSPNYPAVDLETAIEKVAQLYAADGPKGAPVEAAVKHIGYSSGHGQAMTVVSALNKYGLTENRKGRVIPTKRAIDIIEFGKGHERHDIALKDAALEPAAYREIYERYEQHGRLPSDESLKPELVADRGFNPKVVSSFLGGFRKSLEFAGILRDGVLSLSTDDGGFKGDGAENPGPIKVSDLVQWTIAGIAQWRTRRRVISIDEFEGESFAKVEAGDNDKGGHVPVEQLSKGDLAGESRLCLLEPILDPTKAISAIGHLISLTLPRGVTVSIRTTELLSVEERDQIKKLIDFSFADPTENTVPKD